MTTTTLKSKASAGGLIIIELLCMTCFLVSCAGTSSKKPAAISYIKTNALPMRLAVLPVKFLTVKKNTAGEFPAKNNSKKGKFISSITRGVIYNQLAGKGYKMMFLSKIDQKLGSTSAWEKMPPRKLCKKLSVDGLIYPEIITTTMVSAVAYDLFKIDARIKMFNRAGKKLGTWSSSSSKRKISLPTSPEAIAATLIGAFLDQSARKQMRLVIYDWGWKVSQFVPNCPQGKNLPEVVSVDSNIDKGLFAAGKQIRVTATAEKNLTCTFDIGDFKENIPMPSTGNGVYKGIYVVQIGDQAANQPLSIHFTRQNGVERIWMESDGTVTIDGVLPPTPKKIVAQASKDGVSLTWALPQSENLRKFMVERSETAVGHFTTVAKTKGLRYLDTKVSQGHTYYYRIKAVDMAGNRSVHDRTIQVTMPFYDEVKLSGSLSGILVQGLYRLDKGGTVPSGKVLDIGADSRITIGPKASIVVKGILKVTGSAPQPTVFEGQGWKGIIVTPRGQAQLTHTTLKGCTTCMESNGGNVLMQTVSVEGDQGDGIVVKNDGVLTLQGVQVSGCKRAVVVENGRSSIEKSTLNRNTVGLDVEGGEAVLNNSNVFGNTQSNVRTRRKMVLEGNYLGATAVKDLKLDGDILVKSLLDAPYPHGRKVVLVESREITPQEIAKRFKAHKSQGIKAFRDRRFGDAYQNLIIASKLKEDKEIYLYLAYTESSLGEDSKMAETLQKGIAAFPYEVRLYQVYVKYLIAHGKKEKALSLLQKALKMNPESQNLIFMRQYVESMSK